VHNEAHALRVRLEGRVMLTSQKAALYWATRTIEPWCKLVEQRHGPGNTHRISFEDGHLTQTPVNALFYFRGVGVSVHYHKPRGWCVTVLHDGMSASYRRKHDTSTEGFSTRDEAAELATEIVMDLFAPV
jgi:hypothetical protein